MALTDNLISYWKLNESSGNAADEVGGNTLTNNNTVTYSAGKINNAANFASASSQYLSKADIFEYQKGQALSVQSWLNIASTGASFALVGNHVSGATGGWHTEYLSTDKLRFIISNATSDGFADTTDVVGFSTSTWYHVVMTTSNFGVPASQKIYVNGTSAGMTEQATLDANAIGYGVSTFELGAHFVIPAKFLNGSLDEVGIWERELTAAEVTELYNSGAGLAYPFTSTASTPRRRMMMGIGS